ncbi:hypoxanthine phosphoribosyltransferase [Saprospira grandis DSM 2844]|uniref:Hypoxanthine phosphoribosyltransferase n=1 Tax=Saprospira grandis DSM 2844 TaxID=694433 RepID=J0XZZ0_9BACT|nr:hypoxanthine phosphoribosyltransferase [Saprospira grandis]EJF54811.1 hypoxanthine phosphoribosyltransferase [Saprospira grandis DSM 2844]
MKASGQNVKVWDKEFAPFISAQQIEERIEQLARKIEQQYAETEQPIVILGILNGAFRFASDLVKALNIPLEISFVKLQSYSGTSSTGQVTEMIGLDLDLAGRAVLIVEDIVDSGRTLYHFLPSLKAKNCLSVGLCSLLVKPDAMQYKLPIDFAGFAVPNDFLLGYGLDYDKRGRELNDIYKAID